MIKGRTMKSYFNFLGRNKLYTAIEAVGLIVSLGFAILVGSYVYLHRGIAYENPDHDRIYMLNRDRLFLLGNNDKALLDSSVPEVEVSARISGGAGTGSVQIDGGDHVYSYYFIDPEFFGLFPYYEFLAGSPDVMGDRNNVIVTEAFANKVAGSPEAAVGRRFAFTSMGLDETLTIAAVVEDFGNTIFPYQDVLINYKLKEAAEGDMGAFSLTTVTMFRAKEGTDRARLERKVIDLCVRNYEIFHITKDKLKLRTLPEAYFCDESRLINHSDKGMLRLLTIVVIAVLISAVFNYINLSFALSGKRAKEMATRRLVGAGKADIFRSSIFESVLFTLMSFALALLAAVSMKPLLNRLIAGDGARWYVPVDVRFTFGYVSVYIASAVLLGAVAGVLPAAKASGFKPIDVIKGRFRMKNKRIFMKIFIVVQSAIAVVLISVSILMEAQLSHMIRRPMNMKTENIFMISPIGGSDFKSQEVLYNELHKLPFVNRVGITNNVPGSWRVKAYLEDFAGEAMEVNINAWDSTYFNMMSPQIVMDFGSPANYSLWMTESTAAALGYGDNLRDASVEGLRLAYYKEPEHIGGILADIPNDPASSLSFTPYAMTVVIPPSEFGDLMFAVETDSESGEYKDEILKVHDRVAASAGVLPSTPGTADYISDIQRAQLDPVERTVRLVEIFMFISVLLSLLGLLAMSTYYSEQKSKEIAIRKVFGGTIGTETLANVRSYMVMVLIACIIGVPTAVYAAGRYLEQFGYRIENYWWIFGLAVLFSLVISLLSVLWQTLRAARTNPAKELKKE